MKILQVIPYYAPALAFGGPVSVCRELSEALVARGHQVSVVTTDVASRTERVITRREHLGGVDVLRLRNLSLALMRQNFYTPLGAKRALREAAAASDVVHVHDVFHWLAVRAAMESEAQRRPMILSPHGSLSVSAARGRSLVKRAWRATLGRVVDRATARVQVASELEAEECRRYGVAEDKLVRIVNGVAIPTARGDGEAFRKRFGLGDRPVALFVGRLHTAKGVDALIAAAGQVPHLQVVLVGPAEGRADLLPGRRGANLLLTGWLPVPELQNAWDAANFFVLPSHAEGSPRAALEAMAHGLPCMLSDACNLPIALAAGAAVRAPLEKSALAEAMTDLLARRSEWPAMGAAARALVQGEFAPEAMHRQYEALYQELIARRRTDG